jgi:regulator of sirC expression with transglutaminase-like and TPR domain
METGKLKAMVRLLDDTDYEIVSHIENEILSMGPSVIPFLETEWEDTSLNPIIQTKLETVIHALQFENVKLRLLNWIQGGAMDLLEGAWIIATYRFPEYSFKDLKVEMDQLYFDIWTRFRDNIHPIDQIKTINGVFFDELKFGANTKNFHSENNSFINIVLESKKGNPISLCIIYMLIAQRLGIPVYGVNLPNLFVLTYESKQIQFYINVFNRGLIFNKVDIDNYLAQLNLEPNDIYYKPCTNIEIIRRVVRNLIVANEKNLDQEKLNELNILLNILGE